MMGHVVYTFRTPGFLAMDKAMTDDFLVIQIDTLRVDYFRFCTQTLPILIDTFRAYRARVMTDESVLLRRWDAQRQERMVTGRDLGGRDSVGFVWPVTFFDEILCKRSFGISAGVAVGRVSQACEVAKLLAGGVFIVATREIVTGTDLENLNTRLTGLLTQEE
jgi:hypothetical protein